MDGYLLDTCAVSALLDGQHINHANIKSAIDAIEIGAPRFVSAIAVAEIMFGDLMDQASGHSSPRLTAFIREVQNYPVREITKHTRAEYAALRTTLAVKYLPNLLKSNRPRWIDNWPDRATGEKLQIDENDVWICAQARECNLTLVTTDEKMVIRVSNADPSIKFLFVRSV